MFFPTDLGHAEIRWDGPRATLLLDGVESSAVDASDPSYLEFEYMQHMSCALGAALPPPGPVRALHLGGAACALACAWEAARPGSRQVCVEVDALLAQRVREHFPIPRSPRVRIRVGDGRAVVDAARPGAWDVVVRDAFVGGAVPEHLRTRECAAAVARALRPGGLYLLNCAHGGGANAHRDVAAVLEEFPLVLTVQDPKVGRGGPARERRRHRGQRRRVRRRRPGPRAAAPAPARPSLAPRRGPALGRGRPPAPRRLRAVAARLALGRTRRGPAPGTGAAPAPRPPGPSR